MKLKLEYKNTYGELYSNIDKGWEFFCVTIHHINIKDGFYDIEILQSEKHKRKIPMIITKLDNIPIYPYNYPNLLLDNLDAGIAVGINNQLENSILIFEKLMDMLKKSNKHSIEILKLE